LDDLKEAVARVRQGDSAAFRFIVEQTSTRLVRLAARIMGDLAEAEDVVQESYMKAYRALLEGRFDERSKPETWLYSIVTHAAIDALRSRKRRPTPARVSSEMVSAESAEAWMALRELADWLEVLPSEQRAAVVLQSIEGCSSAEAAEILGCSEGALEQRLVRARATLRKMRDAS